MKGNIAIGSRRTIPTSPVAAAVVSEERVDPRKTPCSQFWDWTTSGIVVLRRPPKKIAEMGTPSGRSHSGAMMGHCAAGVQKREFGCDEGSELSGVHERSFQSVKCAGGVEVIPSHHTSPSSVSATFVKIEFPFSMVRIAFALVPHPVPGATPKNPNSGLTA